MKNFLNRMLTIATFCLGATSDVFSHALTELPSSQRFKDQVVIVTGASRGIGRGIALLFAEEGAKVVLVGRDETQLKLVEATIHNKGTQALCIRADVSHPEDMERMVQEALAQFGKIDVLCHNAGIYPHARLENMTLEEWQTVISVNLTGTFLAVKACIPR
jgi:3-oxoacyl-[acyl-carrier protein] reductase